MATQPEEEEELVLTEEDQVDDADTVEGSEADDELAFEIDGIDDEPEKDSGVIREFRQREKEKDKRIKELEQQLKPKAIEVGDEPVWNNKGDEGAAWDYDTERFVAARDAWQERRFKALEQQKEHDEGRRKAQETQQRVIDNYRQRAARLNVPDYKDAEDAVVATLPEPLQNLIMAAAPEPEKLVYALGKNPKALNKVMSIEDPAKRLWELFRMHEGIKVRSKKAPPAPETRVSGSGPISPKDPNKKLEELRRKARQTGDYTAVAEYQRSQKK